MTSIQAFLASLHDLDIKLSLEGDRLRCNAPQGILTSAIKEELAQRKEEIIAFLQEHQNTPQTRQLIKIAPRHQPLPLSFAQQRLWFLQEYEASAVYNMPGAFHFQGELNLGILEKSFREIIQRHEILRTSFENVQGIAHQKINPITPLSIPVIELQDLSPTEQSAQIQSLGQQEAQTSFDLSNGPLIRLKLLKLAAASHLLLITMHHIVSDEWSISILIKELSSFYESFYRGKSPSLPTLSIQYADFAYWQREWLTGEVLETQLNYWKKKLADLPPRLELPTDFSRPPRQTFNGKIQTATLNPHLTEQLKSLSQKSGTTLFMTLLAAFAVLLSRYTQQEDIVIGSPIANRNQQEIEGLIGFFVNMLALRINLENHLSFGELLQQVKTTTLEAYAYQDFPFEKLVEQLQPERSLSYSPLFQVMFVLQNTPLEELKLPELNIKFREIESSVAKFDLTLSIQETGTDLVCQWEYNTDLFTETTVKRMTGYFQTLLEGIVTNPQEKISRLPLISDAEKQQLFEAWNPPKTHYNVNQCVHQLIEQQVKKNPDQIAVNHQQQQLTYQQLNSKANQLAHYLQTLGAKPDHLIGICLERSLEMMIGLLGILKSGAAYLPLDPNYPQERLKLMVEDAQIDILLTEEKLINQFENYQGHLIHWEKNQKAIANYPDTNPISGVQPDNLAYVIYTSGSTGKPKGVLITHENLIPHNLAIIEEYQLGSQDRVLQFASLGFDVCAEEIFPTCITGARLVLRPVQLFSSFRELEDFITEHQITVINLPASYWHSWVQEIDPRQSPSLPSLRLMVVGSEIVLSQDLQKWQDSRGDSPHCINAYGLSETTITTTLYHCTFPSKGLTRSSVPIGRPIASTKIYVFDPYLQPVPIGVRGELYIGGKGVGRGYLHNPALTAEKFIFYADGENEPERLYKTGDLVRYREDGNLEYIGRIDNQVKLRGFRIELGEIEKSLCQHPQVKEAIVISQEDENQNKCLVAYVMMTEIDLKQREINGILKNYLKPQFPDYMIPSIFVLINEFPLTPNGKIDHKALPKPNFRDQTREVMAPRTPTEKKLASIWGEVLKLNKVGVHENFFELGGHSLLATQVVSRLREAFKVQLSIKNLFEYPTLAELSQFIVIQELSQENNEILAEILAQVDELSDEQVQRLLEA